MTLADQLLERLTEWKPSGNGRHSASFTLPEAGWTAHLTAERCESLGCRLDRLELTRNNPSTTGNLKSHAQTVANRVTGLLEPLALIEVDDPRQEALLRSQRPAKKANELHYYEVRFQGLDTVSVQRFVGSHERSNRVAVPFTLTHEAIAKLAEDLTSHS